MKYQVQVQARDGATLATPLKEADFFMFLVAMAKITAKLTKFTFLILVPSFYFPRFLFSPPPSFNIYNKCLFLKFAFWFIFCLVQLQKLDFFFLNGCIV